MENSVGGTEQVLADIISGTTHGRRLQHLQLFLDAFSQKIAQRMVKSMATNNPELSTLKITCKPGMELIQIGLDKLINMFLEGMSIICH